MMPLLGYDIVINILKIPRCFEEKWGKNFDKIIRSLYHDTEIDGKI